MVGTIPQIKLDYIPKGKRRPGTKLVAESITVHNTANLKSTAENERSWLTNDQNTVTASWHYVVDQAHAICAVPPTEIAWHAGCKAGNYSSIGVEVCESGDWNKTYANAVGLVALLLAERNWGIEKVRTHQSWTGKNCPRKLLPIWNQFLKDVKETLDYLKKPKATTPAPAPQPPVQKPVTPAPAVKPKVFTATLLKEGVNGDQTKQLQAALNKLGFNCGVPDGKFGPATKKAVIAFQTKYKLTADGIAGKITLDKLESLL